MLTHHSRSGSQAQQQLQQQQLQQQQQQHIEIQKKQAKAERVRKLWTEFAQWLKHPRNEMERVRDHLFLQTVNLNSHTVKTSRRRIEEAHFSKAREEWQRRLRAADLKESDWEPMNETEMKAVEEALGVDDGEGYITDPSPSPPHRPSYGTASASSTPSVTATPLVPAENLANRSASSLIPGPPMVLAPPMTSASRATSASSSSYECVRPEEFHSDDEESTSDSEFSFSTTISSIISEEDEAVGPVTEYIFTQALESEPYLGVRPSMEVSKESNGPLLTRNVPVSKPVDAGASSQPPPSLAPPKRPPDARQQPQATTTSRSSSTSSNASVSKKPSPPVSTQSAASTKPPAPAPSQSVAASTTTKSSPPVVSTPSSASSSSSKPQQQSKSSRVNYPLVAPSLSDMSDYDEVENDAESDRLSPSLVAQFEAQFEARKLEVRIEKIRQFHELASEADVALSINIVNGRRDRTLSRQGEADLVQRHYESTVALRDRMEKERKEHVNEEKKRLREEYVWRSSSSIQRHSGGLLQQQRPRPPVESDSDDDQDAQERMWERMRQEQLALQAQFNSHESQKVQPTPRRPGTLMLDSMPTSAMSMNDKNFDEANEVLTPRPTTKGGWSVKPPANRAIANVLSESLSRKSGSPLFEPVVQQQQQSFFQEAENGELEADHEDTDNEKERENTGFWSYLTKKKVTNTAPPQSPQSAWNFPSSVSRSPQKPTTAKSRLGIVTSAWDNDDVGVDDKEPVEDVAAEKEVEKEELPQEKTPVISNVSPTNKKQTKKQRQANKKGGAAGAGPSSAATTKAEKAEAPPAPAPPSSSSNTQKGSKTAPIGVPGKSGKKMLDNDDIALTPRQRLQANEEMFNEQENETPTTPRPPAVKKASAAHPANPWARKTMNKNVVNPVFDDGVAADSTLGTTSSRTTLDQVNGKKVTEAVASSPKVPGAWSWGPTTTNDKAKASTEAPSTTTVAGSRKNTGPARQAAVNGVDNTETSKKKGKKTQRGGVNANANGNATNGASNSVWSVKKTTVEEVPDDEADDLHPGSQADKLLPYNSRSILEEMRDSPFDFEEQPRIHEPRPSKPRAVFENIFQYGEPTPDPGLVHDLQDELAWSDERIAQAVARMAQESAEMDRKVNGLNSHNGVNGLNGTNGYLPSSGSVSSGMGMNGAGHVNMANMNRVNMTNMNGSVTAVNGFGHSKPAAAAVDGATTTTKKQVRWQQQQQSQPSNLSGFDDLPRSQPLPSQALVNKMAAVSRSYEDDEAFSPLASTNSGFSGFQSTPSSSSSSSASSASYAHFGGRNTKMNGFSQFGGLSGNHHHSFSDVEPEGNELDRAARSLLENIHVSVSSQQRNKPFSAV